MSRSRFLVQLGRLADATAATEAIFKEELIRIPLTVLPDHTGLLALGRVAMHTDDQDLARRCEQIARTTLQVDFNEARRQLVLLLLLQSLARGDTVGIAEAFDLLGPLREDSVLPLIGWENCDAPHVVRGAMQIGADDIADQVIEQARARKRRNPGVASLRASLAHARGLRHGDGSELRAAVADLDGGPRPLVLASALEDVGAFTARTDDRDEAVDAFGHALELYAGCGASWDARRVRAKLRRLGVRRRLMTVSRPDHGWESLTPTESEVARMIGQGLTNRRAAERLFVSPNTVATHVRHVFEKLGVRSRAELATRIAADAPARMSAPTPE